MALFKRSCYKKKVKEEEEVVLVRGRERVCVGGGKRGGIQSTKEHWINVAI